MWGFVVGGEEFDKNILCKIHFHKKSFSYHFRSFPFCDNRKHIFVVSLTVDFLLFVAHSNHITIATKLKKNRLLFFGKGNMIDFAKRHGQCDRL
jgi:hypothetical protein